MTMKQGAASIILVILCLCQAAEGQTGLRGELRNVIDAPTAGLVSHRAYALDVHLFPQGGVLLQASVGLFRRVDVGCSYGGLNIVGEGDMQWNPRPGFQARIRIRDETMLFPAIAVGVNSQGHGPYVDDADRYDVKSKGIYMVFSKSLWAAGPLGLHAGVNSSLEREDNDHDISGFIAADKDLPARFVLLAEYDLALDDNARDSVFGAGRGYFNAGVRWNLDEKVSLEFNLKNLADNREHTRRVGREMRLAFRDFF